MPTEFNDLDTAPRVLDTMVPERGFEESVRATTRRFYILLMGLIALSALIAIVVMTLDEPSSDIAAVAVIGGVATGALASLAAHDR